MTAYRVRWSDDTGTDGGSITGLSIDAAREVSAAMLTVWPAVSVIRETAREGDTVTPHEETVRAYVACALWASTDEDGEWLDDNYGPGDFAPEALAAMSADVAAFVAAIEAHEIDYSAWDAAQLGHDFWLTRNHHGAGFWDRGHGDAGERLTEVAHSFGESDVYVGDDGRLYVFPEATAAVGRGEA